MNRLVVNRRNYKNLNGVTLTPQNKIIYDYQNEFYLIDGTAINHYYNNYKSGSTFNTFQEYLLDRYKNTLSNLYYSYNVNNSWNLSDLVPYTLNPSNPFNVATSPTEPGGTEPGGTEPGGTEPGGTQQPPPYIEPKNNNMLLILGAVGIGAYLIMNN
jgi:hypothetical protein